MTNATTAATAMLLENINAIEHDTTRHTCTTVFNFIDRVYGDEMRSTTENSEWHREENVWVHTCMAATEFLKNADTQCFSIEMLITGFIAIMYHDVGKPGAAKPHDTIEGRLVFYHHEARSANMFKNDYLSSTTISSICGTPQMMQFIRFIIQSHLPYTIGDNMRVFKASLRFYGSNAGFSDADMFSIFAAILASDNCGRISDDHDKKIENLYSWIDEFFFAEYVYQPSSIRKFGMFHGVLTILSGPPAAGKSTVAKDLGADGVIFSYDDIREELCLELFGHDTCENSIEYEEVEKLLNQRFQVKAKEWNTANRGSIKPVIVDATMVTRRRRVFATHTCRTNSQGYAYRRVKFIDLNLPLSTHLARNTNRVGKKFVPPFNISQNYFSATLPWVDEFEDMVAVMNDSLAFIATHVE